MSQSQPQPGNDVIVPMKVQITKNDKVTKIEVEAIAAMGGLAVTPYWWRDDMATEDGEETLFTITHIDSGAAVYLRLEKDTAIRLMIALVERTAANWHAHMDLLCSGSSLREQCSALKREICDEQG